MAKTGGAGSGLPSQTPRGNSTYDVRTRASDPAYSQYGASQKTAREIEDMMAQGVQDFQNSSFMQMLNTARANNLDPKSGAFAAQKTIFDSTGGFFSTDVSIKGLSAEKQASIRDAEQARWDAYKKLTGADDTLAYASKYYDPKDLDYAVQNRANFSDNFDDRYLVAAGLSDIPTSSSNYLRPRTVAAGYDPEQETLTVVFRDGTFWNYYSVSPSEWIKFHSAFSKGPLLNKGNDATGREDGELYKKPNGPADIGSLSATAQMFMTKALRTAQIYYADKSTGATGANVRAKQRRNLNTARNRAAVGKNPNRGFGLSSKRGGYGAKTKQPS
jgi:hypothetical protein